MVRKRCTSSWILQFYSKCWRFNYQAVGTSFPMLTRNCLSLLLWFLFDGGLLTPLHSQQPPQTSVSKQKENVIITMSGRRSAAQRVKRGWVWNQFFVLEEYMGTEPQYVGKVLFLYDCLVSDVKICRCTVEETDWVWNLAQLSGANILKLVQGESRGIMHMIHKALWKITAMFWMVSIGNFTICRILISTP